MFHVTDEGTRRWLDERIIDNRERALWMVLARGKPIGHIGFARMQEPEWEIDNVLRGVHGHPGAMGWALVRMLERAPGPVTLRVFSDNEHAIGFYERYGFTGHSCIPLRMESTGDGWYRYVPAGGDDPVDRVFLVMRHENDKAAVMP